MPKNENELSKPMPEQQQLDQTVSRSGRKDKQNAQSRARAAKLREKITEVKSKPNEQKTDEEMRLLQIVEERRRKKNERSRERSIKKKMEIERILATPEAMRTPEDVNALDVAMKAKKRKNEGDRTRRVQIKNSMANTKSPGVRGRPRKYASTEPKPKQAKSSTVASAQKSPAADLSSVPQPSKATLASVHALPTTITSFVGPQATLMSNYGYMSPTTDRRSMVPPGATQSSSESMQRKVVTPSELMQTQQQPMSFESSRLQQQCRPDASTTSSVFGAETSSSVASKGPTLSMHDMSHLLLKVGTYSKEENDDAEKHAV